MKKAEMQVQANLPRHPRRLVVGVAVILISGIALGSLAISGPRVEDAASAEMSEPAAASTATSSRNRADSCAECGVIASTREIEGDPVRSRQITVRMQNGSSVVITDPNAANWKKGERVKIIAGLNQ